MKIIEKKALVWKVFLVSFASCVNEALGNMPGSHASVFPRPLNFSTWWLCLTIFDSRDSQGLNERGAVGETAQGAPSLLATRSLVGEDALRQAGIAQIAGGQKPGRDKVPLAHGFTASALPGGHIYSS